MTATSLLPIRTSLALAATALLVAGCAGSNEESTPTASETSTASTAEIEGGVSIEPGLASCQFNNELRDDQGDGTGVSPFGELDRAELREEADAYVVTFTGDFFSTDVLLADDASGNLQITLIGEDLDRPNPGLYTDFWKGEIGITGTVLEGEPHEQDTGAAIEDGVYTATFPKDSPHLEGFEPTMWVASAYLDDGDETTYPVSFRCGDGRNWNWEPLA